MKIGLVGLPGSGKTTCFRVLSGHAGVDTHHGANLAAVPIPDPRLDRIFEILQPKKMTYADVTFVDFEALRKGDASGGELALHKVAGDVDAFALVVQCFGELDHLGEPLDPASDLETVMLEMALSDLSIIEGHLARLAEGPKAERVPQVIDLMTRCGDQLSSGRALRRMEFTEDERKHLRGFAPLTMMPLLAVFNVSEENLSAEGAGPAVAAAEAQGLAHIAICAELEAEIAELAPEDQREFLADYGLDEAARERFVRACFGILDLIMFFTVNENEARAWTIRRGATAPEAAGKVHSDMQAGFIRAEVTPVDVLAELGSKEVCKERGLPRVEGKEYVVQEGDILQIRFSR